MAYRECCIQNYVSNPRFKRCPECGKTFYPCKSCPSLSDKHSHCPVCIYPQFLWKSPHPLRAGEMGAVELVVVMKGRLYIVDLSSYGTSLNRRPLPKGIPVKIQKGDLIAPFTRPDYISKLSFLVNFQIQDKKLLGVELVKRG